jgi:hypothetical protein
MRAFGGPDGERLGHCEVFMPGMINAACGWRQDKAHMGIQCRRKHCFAMIRETAND